MMFNVKISTKMKELRTLKYNQVILGRMTVRGENVKTSPKEQIAMAMNLSGKRTRTRRNSGESCTLQRTATNGESHNVFSRKQSAVSQLLQVVIDETNGVTFRCKDRESI